jgi:hypothetical protein
VIEKVDQATVLDPKQLATGMQTGTKAENNSSQYYVSG